MKFILRLGLALLICLSQHSIGTSIWNCWPTTLRAACPKSFNRHLTTGCVTHGQRDWRLLYHEPLLPRPLSGQKTCWDWMTVCWRSKTWRYGSYGTNSGVEKTVLWKIPKYIKRRNMRRISIMIRWITVSTLYELEILYKRVRKIGYCSLHECWQWKRLFYSAEYYRKPEGPYEISKVTRIKPFFQTLTEACWCSGWYRIFCRSQPITHEPDMSGLAEEIKTLKKYSPEPYEGAFIFKYDGKYHLVQLSRHTARRRGHLYWGRSMKNSL